MTKPKPLTDAEWDEVFRLRCRTKRGEKVTRKEQALIERAWRSDNERYATLENQVFEATKPFGA